MSKTIVAATASLKSELRARTARSSAPQVIHVKIPAGKKIALIPEGSLCVIVARRGDPLIPQLTRAIASGEIAAADKLLHSIGTSQQKFFRKGRSAFKHLKDIPVLCELRYLEKAVVKSIFVEKGNPRAFACLAYNGAKLKDGAFSFVEHLEQTAEDSLQAIVLVREPTLSKIEKSILKQVPVEQASVAIGPGDVSWCIVAATVGVLAVAATIVATYYVYQDMKQQQQQDKQQQQQQQQADANADRQADQQADQQADADQDAQEHQDDDGGRSSIFDFVSRERLTQLRPEAAVRTLLAARVQMLGATSQIAKQKY